MIKAINTDAIKLENSSFIDKKLQETISDLVFTCRYAEHNSKAKVILLVEHQSSPDKFMPFRVYHYLFNLLYREIKAKTKKLPAVYMLVYYHGEQTPYPYSMNLADCFDDPCNIMTDILKGDVPLVDLNQENDSELTQQKLMGIMAIALKHYRNKDSKRYLNLLKEAVNSIDINDKQTLDLVVMVFHYVLSVGNTKDIAKFVEQSHELPEPMRGEIMTIAEQLEARGEARGLKTGQNQVIMSLLKNGADPKYVASMAEVELSEVLKLKTQLEQGK